MDAPERGPRARARKHDWIDERSHALALRVADKLRGQPVLVEHALGNLNRWEQARGPRPAYAEWRRILTESSVDDIIALLSERSERADRLRQSTPFTGILSQDERLSIFRYYETL